MERRDQSGLKTLDIQDVAIHLLHLYIEENDLTIPFVMPMVMTKSVVTEIKENMKPSECFSFQELHSKPFLQNLNYTKIKLAWTRNSSALTHFHPNLKFENKKQREDLFWITCLQNSCGILTTTLHDLTTKLAQQFKQDRFRAKILSNGKIDETEILFSDLQFKLLIVTLNKQYLFAHANTGIEVPSIYKFTDNLDHTIIGIKNRNLVFDLSSMQFGHRGQKGEIVGNFEDFGNYKKRFPGSIRDEVFTKDPKVEAFKRTLNVGLHKPIADALERIEKRIVQRFMKELNDGIEWCSFCGKSLAEPLKCSKCKIKVYCGKNCQTAHWKSHKMSCTRP